MKENDKPKKEILNFLRLLINRFRSSVKVLSVFRAHSFWGANLFWGANSKKSSQTASGIPFWWEYLKIKNVIQMLQWGNSDLPTNSGKSLVS